MEDNKKIQKLQTLAETVRRAHMASLMGMSFGGKRDMYEVLGYEKYLSYLDFFTSYKRQDIAAAIIDRPIKTTWTGGIDVMESDDDKETQFEREWKQLVDDFKLKDKFIRVDRLTALGRYGAILLGLDDVKVKEDALQPVTPGKRKLVYVKPLSEESAKISTWDTKSSSPRYGLPVTYEVSITNPNEASTSITLKVHHSRIIHITGDKLESEVYGLPVLEKVFNRLKDLEKLVGGSAEMFWKSARPGHQARVDDDYTLDADAEEELDKQIDEYEHQLRRIITMQGVELKELTAQVHDPVGHVDVQIQMISAITGIPKRILVGSERGELASSQDQDQWKELIQNRRDEFVKPGIIDPFVERCIEYGILTKYTDTYEMDWSDLFAMSEAQKTDIGKTRASALREYSVNPSAAEHIPPAAFFEYFLGLTEDQIQQIEELRDQAIRDEEQDFDEPKIIVEPKEEDK